MKKIISIILFAILSLSLFGTILAKGEGSSRNLVEKRVRPFYKVARGEFAESASDYEKNHRVRLYKRNPNAVGNYKGTVYIRHSRRSLKRYNLPNPVYTWSVMKPVTIFFANADRDSDNELLIIERNMTGIGPNGSQYFYRTRVYDWNGRGFRHLEKVSKTIGKARTEARVKLILKRMLRKPKAKRIILEPGRYSAKVRGKFNSAKQTILFKVKAKTGQRMIVNIIPISRGLRTAGKVMSPTNNIIGRKIGGVIASSVLKESGDYKIQVTPARIGRSGTGEFMVEVILLPRYFSR